MKRTPLRRKTRIKPVSDKARAEGRGERRSAWRAEVFQRDAGRCRLCTRRATDAHHILYRSQGGRDELGNGIALCRSCHELVHREGGRTWRPKLTALTDTTPTSPTP